MNRFDAPLLDYLFQTTSSGVLIADADGRLSHANAAAAAYLTTPSDQLVGQTPSACFSDNDALRDLFAGDDQRSSIVDLPYKRRAQATAQTIDQNRVVILQDVTDQHELDFRRDAFVTTMAHDLRNPIAALIGYAELVQTVGDLNDEQRHFVKRISQTATKLHDVAAELVELTWIEAGMPLERSRFSLEQTVESVIEELTEFAQGKAITIALSMQKPLPDVLGDPQRIRLVIFKLIHNAILYSGSQQIVVVHAWSADQDVYCSVADRGIGISPDELELIFDRLYRSRSEAVQHLPGGGLGLTIAHRIITRHGGELWAESDLESGSTFTFKLPAHA